MPLGVPSAVCHGPTTFIPLTYDPYVASKEMGIFREIDSHPFRNMNAGEIVQRIMRSRAAYEERQRLKMEKSAIEEVYRQTEKDREA
jgi:ethanolamine-phosphate cytidylyltransferase